MSFVLIISFANRLILTSSRNLITALDTAEARAPQLLSRPHGPEDSLIGLVTDQLQDVD